MKTYLFVATFAVVFASPSTAQELSPRVREALTSYEDALRGLAGERDKLALENNTLTTSQTETKAALEKATSELKTLGESVDALQKRVAAAEAASNVEVFSIVRRIVTLIETTTQDKESLAAQLLGGNTKLPSTLLAPVSEATTASKPSVSDPATRGSQSGQYASLIDTLVTEFKAENRERDIIFRALIANKVGHAGRRVLYANPIK